jgi:hypothetical protein
MITIGTLDTTYQGKWKTVNPRTDYTKAKRKRRKGILQRKL